MSGVKVKHSRLSRYSAIAMLVLGVFTLLFVSGFYGLILTIIGAVMFWFYRRQSRTSEESGKAAASTASLGQADKIACRYCGVLNDQGQTKCASCGAPLR